LITAENRPETLSRFVRQPFQPEQVILERLTCIVSGLFLRLRLVQQVLVRRLPKNLFQLEVKSHEFRH
jgi:hypothetical protein